LGWLTILDKAGKAGHGQNTVARKVLHSTIDLLVLTSLDQLLLTENINYFFTKTSYLNEEVNCIDPSTTVSIPFCNLLLTLENYGRKKFRNIWPRLRRHSDDATRIGDSRNLSSARIFPQLRQNGQENPDRREAAPKGRRKSGDAPTEKERQDGDEDEENGRQPRVSWIVKVLILLHFNLSRRAPRHSAE
jgi:hypothetical protein